LCALKFDDIQDCGDVLNVIIPDSKTNKERRFSIVNEGFGVDPIDLLRRYVALRPKNSPLRFFLHYCKGKCSRQNVGINTFGAIPKKIATFLKLENPTSYTGHSFRRSSATLLVNAGYV
jgi:integrase